MSPQLNRPLPPYQQIVEYYRDRIATGELKPGERLPSTRQLIEQWSVAHATAAKVLALLRADGLVITTSGGGGGTVVADRQRGLTARDRATSVRRSGRIYPTGEQARIVDAELMPAPESVARALELPVGATVVRRHRITYRDGHPVSRSTSWFPGALAESAPDLLRAERIVQGTAGYLEQATGRRMSQGRDELSAGVADLQVAADLGVPEGSVVLVGRNWYRDAQAEVLEYGESVSAPDRAVAYEYDL